jgi:outer membrane protein TolC
VEAARADLRGLWQEASTLHATAVEFRRSALGGAQLTTSAERAYEAGEMEFVALLDAHRSALDAELQTLELEMNARRARIDLDRVAGELP